MSGVDQRALRAAVERVAHPYSDFAQVATRAIEEYVRETEPQEWPEPRFRWVPGSGWVER